MVKLDQKEFPKLYLYYININDTPYLYKDFQYSLRSTQSFYTAIYRTRNIKVWYLLVSQLQKQNLKEAWRRNIHPLYSLEHSSDINLKRQNLLCKSFILK